MASFLGINVFVISFSIIGNLPKMHLKKYKSSKSTLDIALKHISANKNNLVQNGSIKKFKLS